MCGQIGCNKSEFPKKKLMGYWGGWRISEGFGIYLHLLHFQIVFKGRPRFPEKKDWKIPTKKKFLERELLLQGKSTHRPAETPGILDLYVAARQGFPELQMFQKRYWWRTQIAIQKDFYKFLNEGHLFAKPVFVKDSSSSSKFPRVAKTEGRRGALCLICNL